jgi:hypothetical protein
VEPPSLTLTPAIALPTVTPRSDRREGSGPWCAHKFTAEEAVGPADPEVSWRSDGLGTVLRRLGDLAGARAQYERALAISEATLGPDNPNVAIGRGNLGLVLQDLGTWKAPGNSWSRRWPSARRLSAPTHPRGHLPQ